MYSAGGAPHPPPFPPNFFPLLGHQFGPPPQPIPPPSLNGTPNVNGVPPPPVMPPFYPPLHAFPHIPGMLHLSY